MPYNNVTPRCEVCGKARYNGRNRVKHDRCSKLKQQVYGRVKAIADTSYMTLAEAQAIAESGSADA